MIRTLAAVMLSLAGTSAGCAQPNSEIQPFSHAFQLPEMVRIKGGEFLMGSPVSDESSYEYQEDERPQRTVHVGEFYLSKFLVTAEDFCVFLNERGNDGFAVLDPERQPTMEMVEGQYRPRRWSERCPACWVTWSGAVAYCTWLSEKTSHPFRLPTEAEWEYAARGPELRPWPWGVEDPDNNVFTFKKPPFFDHYGYRWIFKPWAPKKPLVRAPVGSFPKNATPDGVLDMLGYYSGEWCSDSYKRGGELPSAGKEPRRIVRGVFHKGTNVTLADILEEKKKAKTILELAAEPSMPQYHRGYSWTRSGEGERTGRALLRLVMDAKRKEGE